MNAVRLSLSYRAPAGDIPIPRALYYSKHLFAAAIDSRVPTFCEPITRFVLSCYDCGNENARSVSVTRPGVHRSAPRGDHSLPPSRPAEVSAIASILPSFLLALLLCFYFTAANITNIVFKLPKIIIQK